MALFENYPNPNWKLPQPEFEGEPNSYFEVTLALTVSYSEPIFKESKYLLFVKSQISECLVFGLESFGIDFTDERIAN